MFGSFWQYPVAANGSGDDCSGMQRSLSGNRDGIAGHVLAIWL